jgi:hypothetical protein
MKLRSIALQQSRQQFKPFGKAGFTVLVQTRPAVIGRNPDILGGRGQQFFGKLANQFGIDAGEFIDLLADTLKIIVIPGSSPVGRVSLIGQARAATACVPAPASQLVSSA